MLNIFKNNILLSLIKKQGKSSVYIKNQKVLLNIIEKNYSVNLIKRTRGIINTNTKSFSTKSTQEEQPNKEDNSKQEQDTNQNENNQNEGEGDQQDTKANYKTSRKIRTGIGKLLKYFFIFGGLLTLYNAYLYKSKDSPQSERLYVKSLNKLVKRIHYYWYLLKGSLTMPFYQKVLPDAVELVGQPPRKTLVINLNKTLINYEYKFGSGFEILKRPGLMKFLQEMGQVYEVVIFGTEDSNFVEEVAGKLDQFEMNIKYKLGKEATRLVNGSYVKDLHFLNRDLKNVVCVDYDPENIKFNPTNAVILPEFNGDGKDRELIMAIVFLKEMAKPDVKDVRKEIEKWGSYKPYIKFYKSNPKYRKLLPAEDHLNDDADLQAVVNNRK